jgi:hypothetical protein
MPWSVAAYPNRVVFLASTATIERLPLTRAWATALGR